MTRQTGAAFRVQGLSELRRDLKRLDSETQRELKQEGKALASDVAEDAKGLAGGLGSVAAKSAPAVGTTSAGRDLLGAGVVLDAGRYPYAAGAEFGAVKYPQFLPHRGSGSDAGYFVYPAIRSHAPRLEERMYDVIDSALRRTDLK